MDPQIRYAQSSDGTSIAYWTIGNGPPIVQTPLLPFSHIEMEWQIPELRAWYTRLADGATVVRYDGRGNGLSDRNVTDLSLDAHVQDLDAVLRSIGPEPATVIGVFHTGLAAIALTARAPELVSHLVLWASYALGADYWRASQAEGLRNLRQTDYRLFLKTGAHELLGWDAGLQAERFADLMQNAVEPSHAEAQLAATRSFDVTSLLASIDRPTLVVHRRQLQWLDISLSRGLAAAIPAARLAVVEGGSPLPGAGETDSALNALHEFLGRPSPRSEDRSDGTVRTVLFTDLADHTPLMRDLGDEKGRDLLRQHDAVIRSALEGHAGTEVKTLGDGIMASFTSVTNAVSSAIAIQRGIRDWNIASGRAGDAVGVRIGLQSGAPIEEDGDLYGSSVIQAARISSEAASGEILVSHTVRDLCVGKGFSFIDRGDFIPKGFEEPLRLWEVAWSDE